MKDKGRLSAEDAWLAAQPENVYDLCPCGCGIKFRYVVKDAKAYAEHQENFVKNFLAENQKSE